MERLVKLSFVMIITTSILLSQDILTSIGDVEYKGKLIEVRRYEVVFLQEGASNPQVIPLWNIKNIMRKDGTFVDLPEMPDIPVEKMSKYEQARRAAEEARKAAEEAIKEKCEANSKLTFIVIPLLNDYYGITEDIETYMDSLCFSIVDKVKGLEYLNSMNVELNNINDFHLLSLGKKLGLDFVAYGFTYTVDVPFKYASNPSATAPYIPFMRDDDTIFDDIISSLILFRVSGSEEQKRSQAVEQAGTYLGLTLFQIDVKTGNKTYLVNNSRARKL